MDFWKSRNLSQAIFARSDGSWRRIGFPRGACLLLGVSSAFLSFNQSVSAACLETGDSIICTGSTSAKDAHVASFNRGDTSIRNEGDMVADGSDLPPGRMAPSAMFGLGDRITLTNNGTIATLGVDAYGLDVIGNHNTLANNGAITTSEKGADGLFALGDRNVLLNTGTIRGGEWAAGLAAQGSDNRLTNAGTIVTTREAAWGLRAIGYGNVLTNSGNVTVSGEVAEGVRIEGTGNALLNTGTIKADGDEARGLSVTQYGIGPSTGANSIVNRGTIQVSGNGADGVRVSSAGGTTLINDISSTTSRG